MTTEPTTPKENVQEILRSLPDDASLDDVIEAIFLRQRLARADSELAAGKTYSHVEVEEFARTWLQ